MNFDIEMKNGIKELKCHGEMTITQIADLQKTIVDIMSDSKEIIVDLSDITDTDIALLQLLCSANRTFEKNRKKLICKGQNTDIIQQALLDSGYDLSEGCPESSCINCVWKGEIE